MKHSTKIWAVGDAQGDLGLKIGKMIFEDQPDHFVYLGDVYETGTINEYKYYDQAFGKLKSITHPIPGNHEYGSDLSGYHEYWPELQTSHSFIAGGWLFLCIDTNLPVSKNSDQYLWTKRQLKFWSGPVALCHHHHRFSAGGHGDQPQLQDIISLFSNRCTVGLSGHTHNMQQFYPKNNYTQFIVGSGGRENYILDSNDPRLNWGMETYGALKLEVAPKFIKYTFVSHNKDVLNEGFVWPYKPINRLF